MRPWKLDVIQDSDLSKHFVSSENSTVRESSLFFEEKLYPNVPYNKMFTRSLSQWIQKTKCNTRDCDW